MSVRRDGDMLECSAFTFVFNIACPQGAAATAATQQLFFTRSPERTLLENNPTVFLKWMSVIERDSPVETKMKKYILENAV